MIATEFYKGQGLGNQLFVYVMTRAIALDKGYDFGILHKELFLGNSFLKLDFGKEVEKDTLKNYFKEERLNHPNGADIRGYDKRIFEIKDNTKIDGLFQGEDYLKHRKDEIREWLNVPEKNIGSNVCIINFRGGEYIGGNSLFLKISYWQNAIQYMRSRVPEIKFKIVTDDTKTAKKFFPEYEVSHDIADDYISIQNAEYLILSNSSFAIFPAWLNQKVKIVVAPKYWARHNISDGYWSLAYNLMRDWIYIDRNGNNFDYTSCVKERDAYMSLNKNKFWVGEPAPYKETIFGKIKKILPKSVKNIIKRIYKKNEDKE